MKFRAYQMAFGQKDEKSEITSGDPVRLHLEITQSGDLNWEVRGIMGKVLADGCTGTRSNWNLEMDFTPHEGLQ